MPSGSKQAGRERGLVMVLFAFAVLMMIAFVALVVDLGLLYSTKARLQTAADAAVFAAAEELPSPALVEAAAVQYAQLNYVDGGTVVAPSDVVLGHWDAGAESFTGVHWDAGAESFTGVHWDAGAESFTGGALPFNAVAVTAQRSQANGNPVQLIFARIFGKQTADVGATAIATRASGGGSRFLIDDEMIDTDIPAIEAVAALVGATTDELLSDADGDWFIDFYDIVAAAKGPLQIELPTG